MNKKDFNTDNIVSEEDSQFVNYLLDKVSDYINDHNVERKQFLLALLKLGTIIFCHQTPLKLKEQLIDIEYFCQCLKDYAGFFANKVNKE
jgi:hypothetical protein